MSSAVGTTRGLSAPRKHEIYEAVLDLLREVGYQGLSMPGIAARARCSTATIYRQWQGKAGLVTAALASHSPGLSADLDTGSLQGDLHALVRLLPDMASGEAELMAALAHAAIRDEDMARVMREEFARPAGAMIDRILERAAARGEIPPDNQARGYCHHLLMSVAISRHIIEGVYPDESYLVGLIDAVLVPALTEGASERCA
jgi:AcrR family transcriptional regulator